jgi:phosphotransferase system HPr-like phosphotransfer protein
MNALDLKNASSCWNSEGKKDDGPNQSCWIQLDFGRPVRPSQLSVQFQAGFSAETCTVQAKSDTTSTDCSSWLSIQNLELEDDHEVQIRPLQPLSDAPLTSLRLIFEDFTDFYGRVTIYRLEVWGVES